MQEPRGAGGESSSNGRHGRRAYRRRARVLDRIGSIP
jgi:hypothetical protein